VFNAVTLDLIRSVCSPSALCAHSLHVHAQYENPTTSYLGHCDGDYDDGLTPPGLYITSNSTDSLSSAADNNSTVYYDHTPYGLQQHHSPLQHQAQQQQGLQGQYYQQQLHSSSATASGGTDGTGTTTVDGSSSAGGASHYYHQQHFQQQQQPGPYLYQPAAQFFNQHQQQQQGGMYGAGGGMIPLEGSYPPMFMQPSSGAIDANGAPVVQVLTQCPDCLVGAMLGRQGSAVVEIQNMTGARVQVTQRDDVSLCALLISNALHRISHTRSL
jgi:hypothetical protein